MSRRLSPAQLSILKEAVRGRRVLDVGDERSQFLASEFAPYAKAWTIIGRSAPEDFTAQHPQIKVMPEKFDECNPRPDPTEVDMVLLPFPSPSLNYDLECLQWTLPYHVVLIFCHPKDEAESGSPGFWKFMKSMTIQEDQRDMWSRLIVMQKPPSLTEPPPPSEESEEDEEEAKEESHGHFPKKGHRYRLAAGFRWPDKKPGERPPIVEITSHWTKGSGPVKILGTGAVLRVRKSDLGAAM
jgi:hypothetical protein